MGGALSIPLKFVCGNKSNERLSNIENDITNIKENHLTHIERDIAIINNNIRQIEVNVAILLNRP